MTIFRQEAGEKNTGVCVCPSVCVHYLLKLKSIHFYSLSWFVKSLIVASFFLVISNDFINCTRNYLKGQILPQIYIKSVHSACKSSVIWHGMWVSPCVFVSPRFQDCVTTLVVLHVFQENNHKIVPTVSEVKKWSLLDCLTAKLNSVKVITAQLTGSTVFLLHWLSAGMILPAALDTVTTDEALNKKKENIRIVCFPECRSFAIVGFWNAPDMTVHTDFNGHGCLWARLHSAFSS